MMHLEIEANLNLGAFNLAVKTKITRDTAGIFGPSGAGKSTLLHLLSGLKKPDSGRISLNDTTLFDSEKKIFIPANKRNIGVVFQDGRLFPHMNVEKNLLFGAGRRGRNAPEINSVVNILDLTRLLKRNPLNLSGGERQRVAIGRALLSGPQMLLLDEPFSAIDMNMRAELLPFISRLHTEFDLPILIISHDLPDILQLTDYLILIDNGKVLDKGHCNDLAFKSNCAGILSKAGVRSCFEGRICHSNAASGIATICHEKGTEPVHIHAPYIKNIENGQAVRAQLTPQDLILSAAPVEYISAQNQLKGIISRMSRIGEKTMVEVNINGLKLLAEITTKASMEFPYEIGGKIWVLFKAWSVNYAPCKENIAAGFSPYANSPKTMNSPVNECCFSPKYKIPAKK